MSYHMSDEPDLPEAFQPEEDTCETCGQQYDGAIPVLGHCAVTGQIICAACEDRGAAAQCDGCTPWHLGEPLTKYADDRLCSECLAIAQADDAEVAQQIEIRDLLLRVHGCLASGDLIERAFRPTLIAVDSRGAEPLMSEIEALLAKELPALKPITTPVAKFNHELWGVEFAAARRIEGSEPLQGQEPKRPPSHNAL